MNNKYQMLVGAAFLAFVLAITAITATAQQSNVGGLAARLRLQSLGVGVAAPAAGNITASGTITGASIAGSGSSLTALNASNLSSGTVPDARFPATLPAASGANLTSLNASNLSSGTLPSGRFPATLPAANGSALTSVNAALLDGRRLVYGVQNGLASSCVGTPLGVTSCTRNASGSYTITFSSAFSSNPVCVVSSRSSSAPTLAVTATSTTAFSMIAVLSGSAFDPDINFVCFGT